jgi:hypothetical protein
LAFNVTMHPQASPGSQGTACKPSPAMQSTEPQAAESLRSVVCEDQGERQVVLTRFEKRRRFWKVGQDRISQWT